MSATAQEKIEALAKSLGVSFAEAETFLACIAFWMSKGLSMQGAVKMHAKTMREGCAIALGKI
jgi:shikimate kinase